MNEPLLAPHDAMARFMSLQTAETFAALRDAVAAHATYNPVDGAMEKLSNLLQRKEYGDAVAFVATLMPNWMANPGVHQACAYALHKQGDIRAARYDVTRKAWPMTARTLPSPWNPPGLPVFVEL